MDIKYTVNGGDVNWVYANQTYTIDLETGDVVVVTIKAKGSTTLTTSWTAGSNRPGSMNNPLVFDGDDLQVTIEGWGDPVFVTIPAGVTVYINGTAQFCSDEYGNDKIGYSVTPDVTTTYAIAADSWMAGAIFNLTTTNPEGGDGEGGEGGEGGNAPLDPTNTLPLESTQINAKDAEYKFTATAPGTLTISKGAQIMADVIITYSVNSDDPIEIPTSGTVNISLYTGDVVVIKIDAAGYSSITASWEEGEAVVEPDGSQDNPYIFDGTTELGGFVMPTYGMPTYFVMIKAGTTAYIHGDAQFDDGFDKLSVITAEFDILVAVVTMNPEGADFTISTEAPAEGGDEEGDDDVGSEPTSIDLPVNTGSSIQITPADTVIVYNFFATENGILTLSLGNPIMGTVTVTYTINGEGPYTLENGNVHELALFYDMIAITVTNDGGYQSIGATWEAVVEPDGSQENPYIFDGSKDLSYLADPGKPSYLVMVKGGTTAYILGKVTFNDGVENFTVVSPEVDTLYAVVTTVPDGASFVITATKPAEGGDGSEYNPFIFDGTAEIQYATGWDNVFVIVKGGVTASITGDATFYADDYFTPFGTTVSPAEDTLYIIKANNWDGAEGVIFVPAEGGDEPAPTVETTLPMTGRSIEFNSNKEYTFVAEVAGTLNLKQNAFINGTYARVIVKVNNGESVTLELNVAQDFVLEAGDVVYITLETDAISSFKPIWTPAA